MKIVTITTIKNEADIIESFIRYHLNIVDEMIILNNGSTDDTNNILDKLLSENLPLIILNDSDKYFEPMEKYNGLLKKAVNEFDADIVCPLDVDEFITCSNGNPRDIIEKIPPSTYYKIKWKTYVPTKNDIQETKFVPSRITHARDETIETFYKVILTGDLYRNYSVILKTGNHDLRFEDRFSNDIHCEECDDLKIAHFPLRSVEQMTSKILVSYPNTLSRKHVDPNMSHHYPLMFNKILEKGYLEIDDVTEFAKQYSLEENKGKKQLDDRGIEIIESPINLDFCKDITVKYDYEITPFTNVLNNYVYFANEIHKFKKNIENSKAEHLQKINDITTEKNELETRFKKNVIALGDKETEIRSLNGEIESLNGEISDLNGKLEKNDVLINELNSEIGKNDIKLKQLNAENNFLNKSSSRNFLIPYIYLLLKSRPSELTLNIKLFGLFKKYDFFDKGYYLNKNPDVLKNFKLGRFSPELHYICFGLNENRKVNGRTFNDKKKLLEYIDDNVI